MDDGAKNVDLERIEAYSDNANAIDSRGRRSASFRRAEVPFKSARATHPSRPTGLADGLELESTPTRSGESAPRHSTVKRMRWFPRFPRLRHGIRLHGHYYIRMAAVLSSGAHKGRQLRYLGLAELIHLPFGSRFLAP